MNAPTGTGALAAFHAAAFVIGVILLFTIPAAGLCVFPPLVFAQLGLINTWLAFGEGRWQDRCLMWGAAMFVLGLPVMCLPAPLSALHAAGLALIRWKVAGLYYYLGEGDVAYDRRVQFSVKQLMFLTLCVSIAFAAARALKMLDGRDELALIQAGGFALAAVAGLLCSHAFALWAVLGTERPGIGAAAALVVAAALGGALAFAMEGPLPPRLTVVALAVVQAMIFSASLFVIRNEGYRLFRIRGPHSPSIRETGAPE